MLELVLLRHGESQWNKENRFTGWEDVDLSDQGQSEAREAGRVLQGRDFDLALTSVLKRAIRTLNLALDEMDRLWLPVEKTWRLNERHYGALTGLNKAETSARHGEEQVKIWRRSYDVLPPLLESHDPRHPKNDPRYRDVAENLLPLGESLKTTVDRVLPFWKERLEPLLKQNRKVLIAAHGNSLRALIMILEKMSPEQIMEENVPTGVPLCYRLRSDLSVESRAYLGDAKMVQAAIDKVKNQGKKH